MAVASILDSMKAFWSVQALNGLCGVKTAMTAPTTQATRTVNAVTELMRIGVLRLAVTMAVMKPQKEIMKELVWQELNMREA